MNDSSCEKYFRLSLSIFNELAQNFEEWSSSTLILSHEIGHSRPRKRALSHREIFALGLRHVVEKPRMSTLQVEIGLGEATISRYVAFSLKGILKVLKEHPDAKISIPTDERYLNELSQRTELYCSSRGYFPLFGVVAVLDGYFTKGTKVTAKTFGGRSDRSSYDPFYSGYTGTGYKHLFLWGIDGAIWATVVMAEGSHHDSYLWQRMREVVEQMWPDSSRFHILADSAFPVNPNNPIIVRALTESEMRTLTPAERRRKEQISSVLKSVRSSAEWGNASLQNAFPGIKKKIRVDDYF